MRLAYEKFKTESEYEIRYMNELLSASLEELMVSAVQRCANAKEVHDQGQPAWIILAVSITLQYINDPQYLKMKFLFLKRVNTRHIMGNFKALKILCSSGSL